jgi:hypothetical protein
MRIFPSFLAAAAMVLELGISTDARAEASFPGDIQNDLHLASAPRCNLCHASPAGGGPVVTPFGQAMVANGLTFGVDASVATALTALANQHIDSDCNHLDDVAELEQLRDPSTGLDFDGSGTAAAGCQGGPSLVPEFGCWASLAGAPLGAGSPSNVVAMVALLAVAGLGARRSTMGAAPAPRTPPAPPPSPRLRWRHAAGEPRDAGARGSCATLPPCDHPPAPGP